MSKAASRSPIVAAVAILAAFVAAGTASVSVKAPTFDETAHILGGYVVLTYGDYHVNPENGILPQVWAAIPLALSGNLKPPDTTSRGWREGLTWNEASNFLFSYGNDSDTMLLETRVMMLLAAAGCGLLVFLISSRIWGRAGGALSLALFALSPTVMANARLVDSDMFSALFFLLSIWGCQQAMERVTPLRLLVFCLGTAGIFLSKMSAPLVIPVFLAILALRLFRRKPLSVEFGSAKFAVSGQFKQALVLTTIILAAGLTAYAAIWAASSFRYPMSTDVSLRPLTAARWNYQEEDKSFPLEVVFFLRKHKIFPESYLYGMAHVLRESKERHAFINGRRSMSGWWWFFPATFAMKTPPELILFFLAGLFAPFARIWFAGGTPAGACSTGNRAVGLKILALARRIGFALIFIAVYVLFSLSANLNIGHRHLLPIYPPLLIIAGGTAYALRGNRGKWLSQARIAAVVLICALLLENAAVFPDYLAYFSPLAGGPSNGYKHLVDSSLDWGQDLKRMKSRIQKGLANGDGEFYTSYFGSVNLNAYGLPGRRLLCAFEQFSSDVFPLKGGTYFISATMLQMDYHPEFADWNGELEALFREYRARFQEFQKARKSRRSDRKRLRELFRDYKIYEKLRFAKLAAALRKWTPDDDIGHSILIYKLSERELRAILDASGATALPIRQ